MICPNCKSYIDACDEHYDPKSKLWSCAPDAVGELRDCLICGRQTVTSHMGLGEGGVLVYLCAKRWFIDMTTTKAPVEFKIQNTWDNFWPPGGSALEGMPAPLPKPEPPEPSYGRKIIIED